MKVKELKMKTLRVILLLVIAVFTLTPSQAQKLIKKELKTENKVADGFQYQWYMYTYSMGNSTLMAAFDLNGNRITPNGYKIPKNNKRPEESGVDYSGGGIFIVRSKNNDAFGSRIVSGYNTKGECVFPEKNCYFIYYLGDGLFKLSFHNDFGKEVAGLYDCKGNCIVSEDKGYDFFLNSNYNMDKAFGKDDPIIKACCKNFQAAYDAKGNCIIPESLGYNLVSYHPEDGLFWCDKKNSNGETYVEHTFSKDGRYYAEGHYWTPFDSMEEFEKNKKPVSTLGGSYASGNASSSSSSSSSSSTSTASTSSSTSSSNTSSSSKKDEGLLYEGDYTEGTYVASNGWTIPPATYHHHYKIYENRMEDEMLMKWNYVGMSNGMRVYENQFDRNVRYFVDGSFNITCYRNIPNGDGFSYTTYTSQFSKGNVVYNINNAGGQGNGGGGNNPTPTPTPTPTPQKTHKCGLCNGTGRVVETNGTSFGNTKWCSECGKTVPDNHYHTTCPSCKGKGYW